MTRQRQFLVTPNHAGERLDHFLSGRLLDLSRSQIKRLIDDGSVTLNGRGVKAGFKLRGDETIMVIRAELSPTFAEAEDIPLVVLYEDSSLIVVDKPAKMVVHPAPGHQQGTLVNALLHHCHDLSGIGGKIRPGIVHRLDKNTSGVMVATKDDRTHNFLARQFKTHSIERQYRALVHGIVQTNKGKIDRAIGRHPVNRKKMSGNVRTGRRAVTHWQVLRRYGQERLSLLDLCLETGRTHQIRVHLSEMHLPIVGDALYGSGRKARGIGDLEVRRQVEQLDRQFLHAWHLGFEHPNGQRMNFYSPLPPELQKLVDLLEDKYGLVPLDLQVP